MALRSLWRRFLTKWLTIWEDFWTEAPELGSLPSTVGHNEPITRFIVHTKGYFSAQNRRAKRKAFMPDPTDNELSCYRTLDLRAVQIWELCRKYVNKRFHARAELVALEITDVGRLQLRPDNDPPRHVTITNWSSDEEERIAWAQVLADRARLYLPSD
jgi:hypothetical protein